jgi:hypothetical protein
MKVVYVVMELRVGHQDSVFFIEICRSEHKNKVKKAVKDLLTAGKFKRRYCIIEEYVLID